MLKVTLDEANGIAVVEPQGALSKEDFVNAAARIDPYLERSGRLNGLVIHVRTFPGWDSFGALVTHFRFVKGHHEHIARVALVTDSALADLAEKVAGHFVSAEVRHFPFDEVDRAREWILAG